MPVTANLNSGANTVGVRVTIAGIGNVLLGDDGVGQHTLGLLRANYRFGEEVELADFGTPGLDLLTRLLGQDALILIDAVENGKGPGTVTVYGRDEIVSELALRRTDNHAPGFAEALLAAEHLGCAPQRVVLIGVSIAAGASLQMSSAARAGAAQACERVIQELRAMGIGVSAAIPQAR